MCIFIQLLRFAVEPLHRSAVTIGEIQAGIEITREQNPAKAVELEAWIEQLAGAFNVLPLDAACFRCWATLMHAQVHRLTVVTHNVRDFSRFDVPLLDPFHRE